MEIKGVSEVASGPIPGTGTAIQALHQNTMGDQETATVNPNLFRLPVRATQDAACLLLILTALFD